jgi:excisionase family DNA binding protein
MATVDVPQEDFLTAAEMARLLRLDIKTVRRHAAELDAYRVGRSVRFPFPLRPPHLSDTPRRPERHR